MTVQERLPEKLPCTSWLDRVDKARRVAVVHAIEGVIQKVRDNILVRSSGSGSTIETKAANS